MNSTLLSHKIFHDPNGKGSYRGCNLSYYNYGDKIAVKSYSTNIAYVIKCSSGEKYTLVSERKYSQTTGRHIKEVEQASPFMVLHVPNCENTPISVFKKEFEKYDISNYSVTPEYFKQASNRKHFLRLVYMFDNYQKYIGGLDNLNEIRNGVIELYLRLCKDIESGKSRNKILKAASEKYEYEKEKQQRLFRKKEGIAKRKQTIITKKALAFLHDDADNLLVRLKQVFVYNNNLDDKQKELFAKVRSMLHVCYDTNIGSRIASYMWIDGEKVCTSQGITVPIEYVRRLCIMWRRNENIIGQKADIYTVVQHTKDFVQIGCHTIPTWNIEAMCKELNV